MSDDGKTLTVKNTSHPQDSDKSVNSEATFTRVANGAAGSHATSGSWRININKVNEDESGRTTTYKSSADGMSLSTPTGESWTAKFDGKDYPIKGSYYVDSVSPEEGQ